MHFCEDSNLSIANTLLQIAKRMTVYMDFHQVANTEFK